MSKDSEVVDAGAVEETETPRPAAKNAKKKPVRRVRVIEVIDDGELDDIEDVLTTLDAVDSAEASDAQPAKPVGKKPADDEPAAKAASFQEPAIGTLSARLRRAPLVPFSVLVVLLAAASSAALYFWNQAAGLSSDKDDRAAAAKVAGDFGSSIFTYDADHLQSQMDHTAALMTGDLKKRYLANEAGVKDTFTKNPTLKLSAKASKVYVGDVNGKFVTALAQLDANLSASTGSAVPSSGVFMITLAKIGGQWRVSDMSTTDPTATSGSSGIPNLAPTATPTPTK